MSISTELNSISKGSTSSNTQNSRNWRASVADWSSRRFDKPDTIWSSINSEMAHHEIVFKDPEVIKRALIMSLELTLITFIIAIPLIAFLFLWYYLDLKDFEKDWSQRTSTIQWLSTMIRTMIRMLSHLVSWFVLYFTFGWEETIVRLTFKWNALEAFVLVPVLGILFQSTDWFDYESTAVDSIYLIPFIIITLYNTIQAAPLITKSDKRIMGTIIGFFIPAFTGIATALLATKILFHVYESLNNSERAMLTLTVLPLYGMIMMIISRHVTSNWYSNHPGTSYIALLLLISVLSFINRLFASGMQTIGTTVLVSIVFGLVELLGRSTLEYRARIFVSMKNCSWVDEKDEYFLLPRVLRLWSDSIVAEMFSELLAIFVAIGSTIWLRISFLNEDFSIVFKDAMISLVIQAGFETFFNCFGILLEQKVGLAIIDVWIERRALFITTCSTFFIIIFLYSIPFALGAFKNSWEDA